MRPSPLVLELEGYLGIAPALKRPMLRSAIERIKDLARLRFNFVAAMRAVAELREERDRALRDLAAARADAERIRRHVVTMTIRDCGCGDWEVRATDRNGHEWLAEGLASLAYVLREAYETPAIDATLAKEATRALLAEAKEKK